MLRMLDVVLSLVGLVAGFPVLLLIYIIGLFSTGHPLFRQERVGRYQQPFTLVKFRTMSVETKSVASHLANPAQITALGGFLRKTKLDELPQLWNVLKGEMSIVGPRPGLFNQQELTEYRAKNGVYQVRPGITGKGQVNNVDMSTPKVLAELDAEMIASMTVSAYFRYILQTVVGKGQGDKIPGSKP